MEVIIPIKHLSITGRRTFSDDKHQHFTMSGNVDDHQIRGELDVNKEEPSFDATLDYAPGRISMSCFTQFSGIAKTSKFK